MEICCMSAQMFFQITFFTILCTTAKITVHFFQHYIEIINNICVFTVLKKLIVLACIRRLHAKSNVTINVKKHCEKMKRTEP